MAVNAYLTVDGRPGPSTSKQGAVDLLSFSYGASQPASVTHPDTVQVGETDMGQVAGRLGIDKEHLLSANPHIKDPSSLKAGQEINVPVRRELHTEHQPENASPGSHHPATDLPNAPLGSSIEASMMKAELDASLQSSQQKKFDATLSNILKKEEDTDDSLTENLK